MASPVWSQTPDTTPPAGTITSPVANARPTSLSVIDGTATDAGSGVKTVSLELTRTWGATTEFWNGSAWSGSGSVPLTVAAPDTAGECDWNTNAGALPAGENLPAGRYTLRLTVQDNSDLTSTLLTRNFYIGSDATQPQVTITSPASGEGGTDLPITVAGTMTDPVNADGTPASGIARFRVHWMRNWNGTNEYWDGISWVSSPPNQWQPAPTPGPNGLIVWKVTPLRPTGADVTRSHYYLTFTAVDRSEVAKTVTSIFGVSEDDSTLPLFDISYPANNAVLTRLTEIRGSASDPNAPNGTPGSGLARVDVRLRRTTAGGQQEYWNGTDWVSSDSMLPSRTEFSWLRNTNLPSGANLPAGQYTVFGISRDRYGNNSTLASRNFTIAATNQAPQAVAQSVNVAKNVARQITLSATQGDEDVLTYAIGTPPQYGILTGTAPNLTYTPTSNYTGSDSFTFTVNDGHGASAAATVSLNVLASETTKPQLTVQTPTANAVLTALPTTFTGVARDPQNPDGTPGSGILSVNVRIERLWNGSAERWDGTKWTSTVNPVFAGTVDNNVDADGWRSWSITPPVPTGANLPSGKYRLKVRTTDLFGNFIEVDTHVFINPNDTTAPVATITFPQEGHSYSQLNEIRGTATDVGSGVGQVNVRLQRVVLVNGTPQTEYWNGSSWITTKNDTSLLTSRGELSWVRYTNLPSGSNLPAGDYSITAQATDRYDRDSALVTRNFKIINSLPVDALVKNNEALNYTGDNIYSTDGAAQTVKQQIFSDGKAIYHIKVQNVDPGVSIMLKVNGDGSPINSGWTVHYYDAQTEGEDITGAVTSAGGWQPLGALTSADKVFRVEVTPPANLTGVVTLPLEIRAQKVTSSSTSPDVVKVVTVAGPNVQPDVRVRSQYLEPGTDDDSTWVANPWVGENTLSSDPTHQLASIFSNGASKFSIGIKNAGTTAADYVMAGVATGSGWQFEFIEDSTQQQISGDVTGSGWGARLEPGEERNITVMATALTPDASNTATFEVRVQSGNNNAGTWTAFLWGDSVQMEVRAQSLAGIHYSTNGGQTWQPFTSAITVPRLATVGFKAIPANASAPWRLVPLSQPVWEHKDDNPVGEIVWLQFTETGTQTVKGSCGNSISGVVNVVEPVE